MRQLCTMAAFASLAALSACASAPTGPASIVGECRVFEDPGFAPQGKRQKDQVAIDTKWIEPGIGAGCFKRPKTT